MRRDRLLLLPFVLLLAGCVCRPPPCRVAPLAIRSAPSTRSPAPSPTSSAPQGPDSVVYDATTGRPVDLAAAVASWSGADVVAFGELHGNRVGAAAELTILRTLAAQSRPVALAMEFFERDTQEVLDRYLVGEVDEETFLETSKRNRAYAATHRPLIELCKARGIPVIAANAPRRLVTAFRKSGEDYEAWRASLPEADQALLPEETTELEDTYRERFMALMGPERGPRFFRAQSLWDDAMAEAMVDFREEHPTHRIFLVVGVFHIRDGLGTITKYRLRRAKDEVRVIGMDVSKDATLPFEDGDLGTADLLVKIPALRPAQAPAGGAARP
jgi:uncharacterized iron-regulated protein